MALQTALAPALIATKGYAAPEVQHVYNRARELCQQVGDAPQLFPVLWGLFAFYFGRTELQTAMEIGEQLLSLARRTPTPSLLILAHLALGATHLLLGALTAACAHLEQAIALYDPQEHRSYTLLYGRDPGVNSRAYVAWALWLLGYPDQARQRFHDTLSLAQKLSHPFTLATTLIFAARCHAHRREPQAAQGLAEAAVTLATEQGLPHPGAAGTILRGWALATQGQEAEGLAQMHQGLAAFRATGAETARPYYLALLAQVYGRAGNTAEGLTALAEALATVQRSGERWWEAELYRLRGELLLRQVPCAGPLRLAGVEPSALSEVQTCLHQALDIARRQGAKSLELRAAMSLSRLWKEQGRRDEAHTLLADVYDWFTEGFDTADLREARALLAECGSVR